MMISLPLRNTEHPLPTTAADPQQLTPTRRHHYNKRGGGVPEASSSQVSKRFSTLFNTHGPPKSVDFLLAFVIDLVREGETLFFCVERAIERGAYVKHNNNAGNLGFDGLHRATPNAFSRFSFDQSQGQCMVVDIQGVGAPPDIYIYIYIYRERERERYTYI